MTDLFRYPRAAGAKARDTSHDAAHAITPAAPLLRDQCLAVIRSSRGLTADEVAGRLGLSILSVRPRITELARLGQIRDSGTRRPNASGRTAIVWTPYQPAYLDRSASAA